MAKSTVVLSAVAVALVAFPGGARAQGLFSTVSMLSGEDVFLPQVVVEDSSGTTTYLTITGYRSTLYQPGQTPQSSLGCQVDVMQIDAAGNLLFQGTGFADADATALTIDWQLNRATLEATGTVYDWVFGQELALDVNLSFSPHGRLMHTVTNNGDPSELLVKESRDSRASGTVQLGGQSLTLTRQAGQLERSQLYTR